MDSSTADAAGVLLNTLATDTHMEFSPELDPATSADSKPILVEAPFDDQKSAVVVEAPREARRPVMTNGKPLPDLRHEQTYLAALSRTDGTFWAIAYMTLKDFLIWPTITQFAYVLGLDGFKYLRTGSTRSGRKFGLLIRDFLNIGGVLD